MRFRVLNKDPLYDYREACKITEGIDLTVNETKYVEGTTTFWIKQIVANHSCLRSIHFRLVDTRPKSVIMQVIRATKGHPQPEVQSSRPDWNNGKERSSDPYEDKLFMQDHTPESFVEMAKQRLCTRTEERTRKFMLEMVIALRNSSDPLLKAVGYCCHPYCGWYGNRCPEIKSCGKNKKLSDDILFLFYGEETLKEAQIDEAIKRG